MTDGLYVICPDLHFPFQDPRFCSMLLQVLEWLKPRGYIQLGDALDFWQLSTYDNDPRRKDDIDQDVALYSKFLDQTSLALSPDAIIHQLEGNHSYRLIRYLWRNAPKLVNIVPTMPSMLGFDKRNEAGRHKWIWHPYTKWDSCRIGDTVLHHGFYYDQNVAVNNLKRYRGVNFIQGHTHRVQYATNGDCFSASLGHGSNVKFTGHKPAPEDWAQCLGLLRVHKGKGSLEIAQRTGNELRIWGHTFKG